MNGRRVTLPLPSRSTHVGIGPRTTLPGYRGATPSKESESATGRTPLSDGKIEGMPTPALVPPPMPSSYPSGLEPFPAGVSREVRLRVVTPEDVAGGTLDERSQEAVIVAKLLRRVRMVESVGTAVMWFALGCVSMAGARGGAYGPWLALALGVWVFSTTLGRRRARLAMRLLSLRGEDESARESLRAKAALSGLGEALRALAGWADDAGAFILLSEAPVSVDPEEPIPDNPIPRDMQGTVRPTKGQPGMPVMRTACYGVEEPLVTPRMATLMGPPPSEPPSHPALSRDPDHDPSTCRVCNPVETPAPYALVFGDSLRPTESTPSHRLAPVPPSVPTLIGTGGAAPITERMGYGYLPSYDVVLDDSSPYPVSVRVREEEDK